MNDVDVHSRLTREEYENLMHEEMRILVKVRDCPGLRDRRSIVG